MVSFPTTIYSMPPRPQTKAAKVKASKNAKAARDVRSIDRMFARGAGKRMAKTASSRLILSMTRRGKPSTTSVPWLRSRRAA